MSEPREWGSFRDYLTWKDWTGAFSLGVLLTSEGFQFARTGSPWYGVLLLAVVLGSVRQCLEFRRKLRTLIELVEPGRA